MSSTPSAPEPGNILAGKYLVEQVLGIGGMGVVVAARHLQLDQRVAIKYLLPAALLNPEVVERFAREARAAAKIRSEHVARVYDVGVLPDGVPFIVMEHLAGQDLSDVLQQRGPLPVKVAVEYVMQACEALAAAHASGVVHRDIKPENLFLTQHAQGLDFIKILDFGISKVALAPGKRGFVRTMMPLGSPVYMSPEQIRSSETVDARTDIWSLGCVLYELLTGTVAFNEPSLMQLSAAILEHDPVPLREYVPDAPEELEEVVRRCLEKDVDQRYGNIAELAIALYRFAPRRSRISAERCYHALKNAGVDCPEFEIASVFPPSMGDVPLSASGAASVTGVSSAAPRRATSAGARRATSRAARTGGASASARQAGATTTAAELESMRPAKKYRVVGLFALIAVAAAGGFFALQTRNASSSTPGDSAAAQVAPTPQAVVHAAKPTAVLDLDTFSPTVAPGSAAPGTAAGSSASAHVAHPGSLQPRRALAPPPAVAGKAGAPPRKHDDEVDVGY